MFTAEDLRAFYGTENWYRDGIFSRIVYTDGVRHVAVNGACYWLVQAMASHYSRAGLAKLESSDALEWHIWQLEIAEDDSAVLTCRRDTNTDPIITQHFEFAHVDSPMRSLKFYGAAMDENLWCLMLPSEY